MLWVYKMEVKAYFETKKQIRHAHLVARFQDEATYDMCYPSLEKLANRQGYMLTESIDDNENILSEV